MSSVPIGSDIDVAAALRHLSPERGWLVLPAFAEPHAHLDKACLAERCENVTGDLMGAIDAMVAYSPQITLDDIVERAERAALLMLANGTTAIRTHADVMAEKGLRNVEALLTVRERLAHLVDIEIVVLCGWPSCGEIGKVHLDLMREAANCSAFNPVMRKISASGITPNCNNCRAISWAFFSSPCCKPCSRPCCKPSRIPQR